MKSASVQFIIVAYHPEKAVFRELLLHLSPNPVIVVDNGGVDVSSITNVEVVHPGQNLGYGGGANLGMQKAFDAGAQWVVILNQDLEVSVRAVNNFVMALEKLSPGLAGPIVGGLDEVRWSTVLGSKKKFKDQYISGTWMAIHKEVVAKVGQFHEPYFMYYEDADLSVRAKKAGYLIQRIAVSGLKHGESTSLGRGSAATEYYLARNHMLFVERLAPWMVKLHEWVRLPKTIAEYKQNGNTGALHGLRDYCFRRFGPYKEQV
jgi:GT2 family glycosyltransferase